MIIDAHTHVWPDKLAARALSTAALDMPTVGDGTVNGLLQALDTAGIEQAVCLAVADTSTRVKAANNFVSTLDDRLIGFGTIHVDLSPELLLEDLRRHKLVGIKIHPLFQRYALDDPRLLKILDVLQEEFIVVVHVGAGKDTETNKLCSPLKAKNLLRQLPKLRLIACHFGGFRALDEAVEHLVGTTATLDTSWPPSLGHLAPTEVRQLIEKHGPERIVFGSDWPMADPVAEVAAIEALNLSPEATQLVLGDSLRALINQ